MGVGSGCNGGAQRASIATKWRVGSSGGAASSRRASLNLWETSRSALSHLPAPGRSRESIRPSRKRNSLEEKTRSLVLRGAYLLMVSFSTKGPSNAARGCPAHGPRAAPASSFSLAAATRCSTIVCAAAAPAPATVDGRWATFCCRRAGLQCFSAKQANLLRRCCFPSSLG